MDHAELATNLLAIISPGDAMIQRMIAAGEPITAVITLIEVAARQRRVVPQALLDAVQRLLDEHAIDAEDVTGAAADLNALHAAALTLQ